jgi:glycosyltransferase involved in cell wall biosynthesis
MDETASSTPMISIVCPVYNEQDAVPIFFDRLYSAIGPLQDKFNFELIFMNNASTDSSLDAIMNLRAMHDWVHVITLSRNFGYQASLTCGLTNAVGDATIFIDVDCEDPPEMIPDFIQHWQSGFDIVYGQRVSRPESRVMVVARKIFYRLTRLIADNDFILDMAEFALLSGRVRAICLRNRSTYPFIRSEIAYAGFKRYNIPFRRQTRIAGVTHYNLVRMFRFAIGGILSASTFPLRLAAYAAALLVPLNLIVALICLFSRDIDIRPLILLNWTAITFAAGSISLYVARIYKDGVNRPLYVIDQDSTAIPRAVLHHGELRA